MKIYILLFVSCAVLADSIENDSFELPRDKRRAAGALDILTNHAHPIHADVKPEVANEVTEKVIPPSDTTYEQKSLRKSLPLTSKLDVIRSVTRIATLVVLIASAVLEFYPMLQFLYYIVYNFIYVK